MKLLISENQLNKLLLELSPKSEGVKEFISRVKETPGLLKHLGFKNMKALEDFITDNGIKDFYALKKDAADFKKESEDK
jgi:hypothetical protein